jgi:large subunit ribosomal protein L13
VIDVSGLTLGRAATAIAKRLLAGEEIALVNAEKAIIRGKKDAIVARYKHKVDMHGKGNPERMGAPQYSRMPHRIVWSAVRGMLPNKQARGRQALARLKVFIGVPKELESQKAESIEGARIAAEEFVTVKELSLALGARVVE